MLSKKLIKYIYSIWQGVVESVAAFFSASSYTDNGTVVGGGLTYSSPNATPEASQGPIGYDCEISGDMTVGETLTITYKVENNSSKADGDHELKLYRADDVNGTNMTLVTTLTDFDQVGNEVSFDYVLQAGQTGYRLCAEPSPELSDGTTGYGERSLITVDTVAPASSIYDYFDIGWSDETTIPADWNSNPAAVWAARAGAWAAGSKGASGFPELVDSATDYLDFIQANLDYTSRPLPGIALSLGFEFWFEFQSMITSGTHSILSWSGTGTIRSVSGNVQLRLGGTGATLFPASAVNGHYLVRIQCNGGTSGNKVWIKQKGAVGYLVSAGPQYNVTTDVGSTVPTASTTMFLGATSSGGSPYGTFRLSGWGIRKNAGLDADAQLIFDDF